jgi:carboxypeptidase Taq
MKESLDFIYREQRELSKFAGIAALLDWDQKTYMPPMGSKERAEQISLISRLAHEKFISEELFNHVKRLSFSKNLEKLKEGDKKVVLRLKKDIEKARKVPPEFVEKLSRTTSLAYAAWEKARRKNNFSVFSPHLEKIIELEREYCEFIDMPGHPYNSLLDDYEEGMTVDRLEKEFDRLRNSLSEILQDVTSSDIYMQRRKFKVGLNVEKQEIICRFILKQMNLSSKRSRIDVSAHPFTSSMGSDDVRVTTNYEHDNPFFSFFSTIHEAGHALYDLGLPKGRFKDTVISAVPSYGLHESQSRFWENMVARSIHFWSYLCPILEKTFHVQLKDLDAETLYRYVNQVRPSFIRVEADELTYCLHIILRFELELCLIDREIRVSELPSLWREKMNEMLGVTPESDRDGVLQDMHWSCGEFGYFPSYAIGSIYAAQLYDKLLRERDHVVDEIERGDFRGIIGWLREHIYKHGRLMSAEEIIKNTCGEGLNSKVFIKYLKDKYSSLYGI